MDIGLDASVLEMPAQHTPQKSKVKGKTLPCFPFSDLIAGCYEVFRRVSFGRITRPLAGVHFSFFLLLVVVVGGTISRIEAPIKQGLINLTHTHSTNNHCHSYFNEFLKKGS